MANGFSWNYGLQLHYYEKQNCASTDSVRTDVSSKTSGVNRLSSGLAVCTRLQQTGCHGSDHYSTDKQSYAVSCLAIFLFAWIRFLQSFGNTEHNNAFKPTEKKLDLSYSWWVLMSFVLWLKMTLKFPLAQTEVKKFKFFQIWLMRSTVPMIGCNVVE